MDFPNVVNFVSKSKTLPLEVSEKKIKLKDQVLEGPWLIKLESP